MPSSRTTAEGGRLTCAVAGWVLHDTPLPSGLVRLAEALRFRLTGNLPPSSSAGWPDSAAALSPVVLLGQAASDSHMAHLWRNHPVAICLNVGAYAAGAVVLFLWMCFRFDRIVGRQPGG